MSRDLKDFPGLTAEERGAVISYEEAKKRYAPAVMADLFGPGAEGGETSTHKAAAIERIEDAYARLSELAPETTPGRGSRGVNPRALRPERSTGGVPDYAELLQLLRARKLGAKDARLTTDPSIPEKPSLPEPKALLFCLFDLEHYAFMTGGALEHVGRRSRERLYDLAEEVRERMSEEEIAGAHGDRNELLMRLYRVVEALSSDTPEDRRQAMFGLGYQAGEQGQVFYSAYEGDPDYVDGFVRGCAARLEEADMEGELGEDDLKAEDWIAMWEDPDLSAEERREIVLEPLKAGCEVREDEGEMWRL